MTCIGEWVLSYRYSDLQKLNEYVSDNVLIILLNGAEYGENFLRGRERSLGEKCSNCLIYSKKEEWIQILILNLINLGQK